MHSRCFFFGRVVSLKMVSQSFILVKFALKVDPKYEVQDLDDSAARAGEAREMETSRKTLSHCKCRRVSLTL